MSTNHRIRFPSRLLIPLILLIALTTGCQTTVGNYFGNRGRDFGECFMVQAGLGFGLGADIKAGGLAHVGGVAALQSPTASIGWVYGKPRPATKSPGHFPFEGDAGIPLSMFREGFLHLTFIFRWDRHYAHGCFGLLPALFSWTGTQVPTVLSQTWLWSQETTKDDKHSGRYRSWARIHAFDIEAGVFALIVGARVGFSPGEFVDFLLGWFGVDIAGDDRALEPQEWAGQNEAEE